MTKVLLFPVAVVGLAHGLGLGAEPPLIEKEFSRESDPKVIIEAAREFMHGDCVAEIDAAWDLWDYNGTDWKLAPVPVTLACLGPEFDNDSDDNLRIEFGVDSRFLPVAGVEGSVRMGQSNLRSLVHLAEQIERAMNVERRLIWSESGANFADVLKQAVGTFYVN